jgi:hypothetical protein
MMRPKQYMFPFTCPFRLGCVFSSDLFRYPQMTH